MGIVAFRVTSAGRFTAVFLKFGRTWTKSARPLHLD